MQERITAASLHMLFFTLELNRIPDEQLDAAMGDPALGHYRPWIEDVRKEKPYQLEDRVEELFHEKSVTGYSAWNRSFDETIAGLRFKVGGKPLAIEPTLNLLQDADGKKRKAAAEALAKTFKENLRPFALITNTLAKDKEISDRWRGFKDIADSRHLSNRVEREVVEALGRCRARRLSEIVASLLRFEGKMVRQEAIAALGPQCAAAEGRTAHDSLDRRARDGAHSLWRILAAHGGGRRPVLRQELDRCAGASGKTAGRLFASDRAVGASLRLAQLYGQAARRDDACARTRAWRASGAGRAQRRVDGADAADARGNRSVFGEMLTFRKLLADTTDKKQRKAMLAAKVEDMINTVVRQIAFYSFERKVHGERRNGELTADKICELWMSVQSESLGPAIELKPGYETFWAYIPHFVHSPFYVYAYAFGDCLVNSLYAVYEKSASGFAERYLAMLSAGGTKHHSELLAPFGLDARDPKFWDGGLNVIANLIDELEKMEGR